MKTNIKCKEDIFHTKWYHWDEQCDMCGKHIETYGVETTQQPDIGGLDLCADCVRLLRHQGIPYRESAQMCGHSKGIA